MGKGKCVYMLIFYSKLLILQLLVDRFNQANSLHTHRAYIHAGQNRRHSCPLCGRLYKTLQLLKRHCKINHQDENVNLNIPPSTTISKRQFYCSDCGESFSQKSLLTSHKEIEHANLLADEVLIFKKYSSK